jgi:hypothetical protein
MAPEVASDDPGRSREQLASAVRGVSKIGFYESNWCSMKSEECGRAG